MTHKLWQVSRRFLYAPPPDVTVPIDVGVKVDEGCTVVAIPPWFNVDVFVLVDGVTVLVTV